MAWTMLVDDENTRHGPQQDLICKTKTNSLARSKNQRTLGEVEGAKAALLCASTIH